MNYLRSFLDSFRERATAVRDYISVFVFGEPSVSVDEVEDDVFHDAEDSAADNLVTETKALKGGITHYTIKAQGVTDPSSFMEFCKPNVIQLMKPETKD